MAADELDEVVAAARELGLAVHLDGTRLLHAAVAQGVPPARIAAQFDTVTICSRRARLPARRAARGNGGADPARVA